jgi:hypothetical protein
MLFTVKQIKQLHTLLQEYPRATHIGVREVDNGSMIGLDTHATFIVWKFSHQSETLETVNITDVGTW